MHNGFINVDNEKMSKSAGNFFTVRDIAKDFDLEAVRMFMLSAHYRSPINFSREMIEQAKASLDRLYTAKDNYEFLLKFAGDGELRPEDQVLMDAASIARDNFEDAMDDDLNTADAIGSIFELVRKANTQINDQTPAVVIRKVLDTLVELTGVIGLLTRKEEKADTDVNALVEARAKARAEKNWAESDRLRDLIQSMGYVIKDTKQGQQVTKAM